MPLLDCFSPLAEALQVGDVISMIDDHVNPHVLFAAFCACKIYILGKQMLVFFTSHRHLFFLI